MASINHDAIGVQTPDVQRAENLTIVQGMKNNNQRNYGQRVDPAAIPEIARRLRLLRKAVADNITQLSIQTGITRSAWSNYENGLSRIGVDAAMKLRIYGATLDWIYFGDEEFLRAGLRERIKAEAEKEAAEEPGSKRA